LFRRRLTVAAALVLPLVTAVTCSEPVDDRRSLKPGANPFDSRHPLWAPQPHRDNPYALALSADGSKLYVVLQGVEDEPGHEVAVVDVANERVLRRVEVGSSPTGIALHPGGRYAVVTNRYSNFASVIDLARDVVVRSVPVPFYTTEIAFHPDGRRAYLSNRWKDSVLRWDIDASGSFTVTGTNYDGVPDDQPMGIAVGANPRDLALSPDGTRLYVGSPTALTMSIIDTDDESELERVYLGSPPGDVVVTDDFVFISHTGRGTHHPPDIGYDTNHDGEPGDGTANVMFQDLQNEIGVLSRDGQWRHNYTSDTICCFDYRDVDPDDPTRGEALPAPDTWPASRVAHLPPQDSWLVACALPEQMAWIDQRLLVVCSGSNEVQGFDVADNGALSPRQTAGGLYRTGMNPHGIAVAPDGSRAFVAERLGEYVTVLDLQAGPGSERRILVGDVGAGEFPATDAEIGAAINFVTAGFTIDGDQTCVHCHREGGNLAKPVAMPLQGNTVWGARMQMAYRGAFDSRPWFMESSMDETNFFPVINEFARKENFCCEQLDPLVWGDYPSAASCFDQPEQEGCDHVLDCADNPPPGCATRGYGSEHALRSEHFVAAANDLLGRERTFGDALYDEYVDADGTTVREGIRLDFNGVTLAIGLFLLSRPRFYPNPNATLALPAARRGRELFESAETGCASCHPLPITTVTPDFNPFGVPLRFPALVTPRYDGQTGEVADDVNPLFLGTFPETQQDVSGLHFGVPQLRGIWDRAGAFLHDGRAPSLIEALASPGHPALAPDQTGFNETDGMPDTHGGTSQLSAAQLEDLAAFLETL
jgi:DNA-binding beta-propeller fold protein YncE